MKKAAVWNDLSGFGKCSLTAAIPVLSVLGIQPCPVVTAVLTSQTGFDHFTCTDLTSMLDDYIRDWRTEDDHFDGIYSGYMTDSGQIGHFEKFLDAFYRKDTFLLVDPILGDNGKTYKIYTDDLLNSMKRIARRADLITPNLTEACLLTDEDVDEILKLRKTEDLLAKAGRLAEILHKQAEKEQDIVITGIICREEEAPSVCNLVYSQRKISTVYSPFYDCSFSGTGDLFASVLCGCRINGMSTRSSAKLASDFICHGIADTIKGPETYNPNDGIHFESRLIDLIKGGTKYA